MHAEAVMSRMVAAIIVASVLIVILGPAIISIMINVS